MSKDIVFRSDMRAFLVDHMGGDDSVVRSARVSLASDLKQVSWEHKRGLIWHLMRKRHGSPFESAVFQFRVECPLFAAREFFRHRIASYNEVSARYSQIEPAFWVPAAARPLVQTGKPADYDMRPGTVEQYTGAVATLRENATICYRRYEEMLEAGICREVARAVLPVSVYTSFYVTMNARSLMNFLSLRTSDPDAAYPSKPQYEIEQTALAMEEQFRKFMPLTHTAFDENGRTAP